MASERMRPSICRAVHRWNLLQVQLLSDHLQRHPLPEHRVDPRPPLVVASVAEPMRELDVVGGEVTSCIFNLGWILA
jgi:hypothetical protein